MRDAIASAPGRVNLIGEHTDYNGGFVLPMPIAQRTTVRLRACGGDLISVTSQLGKAAFCIGDERQSGTWLDYVMGCTAALRAAGHRLGGCELEISSDVPVGSGLSSSAALEIAVLRALRTACDLSIDDVALALLGQRAENELVGAPVGAMDQMVASLGVAGEALFIDMRSLENRVVRIAETIDVVVISSGISHANATGDYRTRRAECEQAAQLLGVAQLRDARLDQLAALPEPLRRRARHVVTEDARVLSTIEPLECGNAFVLGELFAASHRSMRDDYEVSIPAIDALVEIATADRDIIGARLTGGGFGGSIVALARAGMGARAAERVCERYRDRVGHEPIILLAGLPS